MINDNNMIDIPIILALIGINVGFILFWVVVVVVVVVVEVGASDSVIANTVK